MSDTKLIVYIDALHNVPWGSVVFCNMGLWATTKQGSALEAKSGYNCIHAIREVVCGWNGTCVLLSICIAACEDDKWPQDAIASERTYMSPRELTQDYDNTLGA